MSKHPVLTAEDRKAHPGWAVRFSDGSWLCTNMMCSPVDDAFYATRYDTKEIAEYEVKQILLDNPSVHKIMPAEIIEAWQPLCESLRVRISSLKDACAITPDLIFDMTLELENVLSTLKEAQKPKKKKK